MQKNFRDLSEREILALAISLEEEDIRTNNDVAEAMRENYPGTARVFTEDFSVLLERRDRCAATDNKVLSPDKARQATR